MFAGSQYLLDDILVTICFVLFWFFCMTIITLINGFFKMVLNHP